MTLSVRMIVLTRRPSLACPVAIMHFSTEFERGIRLGVGQHEAETSRCKQNSTIDLEIDVCTQSNSLLKIENSTRSACPRETGVRKKRLVPIVVIPILSYLSPSSGQQKTFGEKTESNSWKREGPIPKINYIGKQRQHLRSQESPDTCARIDASTTKNGESYIRVD